MVTQVLDIIMDPVPWVTDWHTVTLAGNYGNGTAVGDIVDRVETGRKWHFKAGGNVSTLCLDDS